MFRPKGQNPSQAPKKSWLDVMVLIASAVNYNDDHGQLLNIYAKKNGKNLELANRDGLLHLGRKARGKALKEIMKQLDDAIPKSKNESESKNCLNKILSGTEFTKKMGEVITELNKFSNGMEREIKQDFKLEKLSYESTQDLLNDPRFQFFVILYVALNKAKNGAPAGTVYSELESNFSKIKLASGSDAVRIKGYDNIQLKDYEDLGSINAEEKSKFKLPTVSEMQAVIKEKTPKYDDRAEVSSAVDHNTGADEKHNTPGGKR